MASTTTSSTQSVVDLLLSLPAETRDQILKGLSSDQLLEMERLTRWFPQAGPQAEAYKSEADILFYGGAAGGGKTDLILGLASQEHWRTVLFRRQYPSLAGIIVRSKEIYRLGGSFNASDYEWHFNDGRSIRFGALNLEDDVQKWQGQPHDLYLFDELPEFSEAQFRFVTGWNRTTREGQRCRIVCTGNPPTDSDGEWVIRFFAPWLDKGHPRPAKPGELRYFTTDDKGNEIEVEDGSERFVSDAVGYVRPVSRTFIPAKLHNNKYLMRTGYGARLNALPEPLRSKMLFGDFEIGRSDAAFQVIPTAWVVAAQERWKLTPKPAIMDAIGVDVARGGKDNTIVAPRYGAWFDELQVHPGTATIDGPHVAGLVMVARKGDPVINIDVIGVGTSPYDTLASWYGSRAVAMNGSAKTEERTADDQKVLGFFNKRALWHWRMREALDPVFGMNICLPPDPILLLDLTAPRWKPTSRGIQVEEKADIIKRIKRSPDRGDAVIYANAIEHTPGKGLLDFMAAELAERGYAHED